MIPQNINITGKLYIHMQMKSFMKRICEQQMLSYCGAAQPLCECSLESHNCKIHPTFCQHVQMLPLFMHCLCQSELTQLLCNALKLLSCISYSNHLIMVTLCNRADHIFLPCGFFFLSSFSSSPNLSSRRLDVYHTSSHGVALV